MSENALHFWRLGANDTELYSGVDYTIAPPYVLEFAANKNGASKVPWVGHAEAVVDAP